MRKTAIIMAIMAAVVCIDCGGKAAQTLPAETGGGALLAAEEDTAARADADYCFDLRRRRDTGRGLLLVKKYNDLTVRTVEDAEAPVVCESEYLGSGGVEGIDFIIDTSGTSISFYTRRGVAGCSGCYGPDTLPREIKIDPPEYMIMRLPDGIGWYSEGPQKDKEEVFKKLLMFKDKIVDGYMTASPNCEPHKLEYKIKFRARITGECECECLN